MPLSELRSASAALTLRIVWITSILLLVAFLAGILSIRAASRRLDEMKRVASWILRVLKDPDGDGVRETVRKEVAEFARGRVVFLGYPIGKNSPLAGVSMRTLGEIRGLYRMVVTAISRHGKTITPRGEDLVEAGDALTDGPLVPHDILRIKGEEALQRYLIGEIQNVYRSQNVNINDKHIEIIISQMMRKVEIDSVGDSTFLPGEVTDKFVFRKENERLSNSLRVSDKGDVTELEEGQILEKKDLAKANEKIEVLGGNPAKGRKPKPATAKTLLLGITKASLWSDSFIAAASFQETTKVLTEAALAGKVDELHGLKENVILGHLIPAGTAFKPHLEMRVKHLVEAPVPKELAGVREEKEAEAKAESRVKEILGID